MVDAMQMRQTKGCGDLLGDTTTKTSSCRIPKVGLSSGYIVRKAGCFGMDGAKWIRQPDILNMHPPQSDPFQALKVVNTRSNIYCMNKFPEWLNLCKQYDTG